MKLVNELRDNLIYHLLYLQQITASDADDSGHIHGQVVYSMDSDASFDINSDSGEIRTLVALDYETTTSYTLTVYAIDRCVVNF